jgi:hypothetical protein
VTTTLKHLRKVKKAAKITFPLPFQSLNSKQRTMKKNGQELSEVDQMELDRVTSEVSDTSKILEKIRKQSRQHTMIVNDYRNKKQKTLQAHQDPNAPQEQIGQPQLQQQQQLHPGAYPTKSYKYVITIANICELHILHFCHL